MTKAKKTGVNKKRIIFVNSLLFVSISLLLTWSIRAYFNIGRDNFTNDAQIEEFINPVNSKVQAYVKEIKFKEHQKISAGDTLIILDNSEYLIRLDQAEATLMNAIASRDQTEASIEKVKANIEVADANIAAAQAKLTNVEQNYTRYKNLLEADAITQAQFDQIQTEHDATKAQLEALISQKKSIQLSIVEVTKRLALNDAGVKQAKAGYDMAKLHLSYCSIIAPYDCVAGRRTIQEGQLIQPGQSLLSIVRDNEKWIVANFRENQMQHIAIGKEVSISVDALNKKEYTGRISAISQASGSKLSAIPVDNSTGNFVKVQQRFPVRIDFMSESIDNLELLRAGMNVEITIKD